MGVEQWLGSWAGCLVDLSCDIKVGGITIKLAQIEGCDTKVGANCVAKQQV